MKLDRTLIDKDKTPSAEELKKYFQRNDYTTFKSTYNPSCASQPQMKLYMKAKGFFKEKWMSMQKSMGGKGSLKNFSANYNAVKMMTYNVLNVWASNGSAGSRDDVTAALIREQDLDFVCLQEFDVWYRNSPNGLNDLLDGDYAEVCVDGVNPDDIWNPIFYKADTWEVEVSGCLKMLDHVACIEYNNYVGTSDGVTRFRSLVWAVMVNRNDGSRYLVGNLHYSALSGTDAPNAVHNVHDHSQESDLCIRTIQELVRQYNCPALIGGDYNSTVGSEKGGAYRMLQNGFSDAYALAAFKSMDEQKYASQIDHIFTTSQDLNVLGYYVLDTEQLRSNSDHLPVMIHFQLNQQS